MINRVWLGVLRLLGLTTLQQRDVLIKEIFALERELDRLSVENVRLDRREQIGMGYAGRTSGVRQRSPPLPLRASWRT